MKTGRLTAPVGAFVEDVSEGSAAEKGGLRKGDIIVEFDGERVRSARQLTRLVHGDAGWRARCTTVGVRDGQRVTLTVEPRVDGADGFDAFQDLADWGRDFSFALPKPAKIAPLVNVPKIPAPGAWRMDELISGGRRLGISVETLSPQLADYFGTKDGVLVTTVQSDSAAAKAGLKAGDVITTPEWVGDRRACGFAPAYSGPGGGRRVHARGDARQETADSEGKDRVDGQAENLQVCGLTTYAPAAASERPCVREDGGPTSVAS